MSTSGVPSVDEIVKSGIPVFGGEPVRRKPNRRKKAVPYGLASSGVLWLLVFFVLPSFYMLYVSLSSGLLGTQQFTWQWSNYTSQITEFQSQLIRSLYYATVVTALTLVVAYPLAYWIAFYGGRRKNTYLLLLLLPFFVSFIIRTVEWSFILADNGFVLGTLKNWGLLPKSFKVLSTATAVIAGMAYNFLPFTALPVYVALERIDPKLLEAGKDLYANPATVFRKVIWPLSLPGVFAAFLLTFVPAVGDYVNSALLGGLHTTMIGQIIQSRYLNLDYPRGAALSFLLMAVLLIGGIAYAKALGTEDVLETAAR
jgi:spermidine/putrescine transport system permease protein